MGRDLHYLSTAGAVLLLVAATSPFSGLALAQAKRPPSLFQGFSGNSDQPINITSEKLDVYEADQKAVFTGKVVATQGDAVLRSGVLTVFYDDSGDSAPAAKPAPEERARAVTRLEAVGAVVVTSADQKAESEIG